MEKEFEELISIRCQKALEECKDYLEKEFSGSIPQDELQAMAEKLCYKKGFKDALAILKCSHNM